MAVPTHLHIVYGCFCTTMKELSSFRLLGPQSWNICHLALYRSNMSTLLLRISPVPSLISSVLPFTQFFPDTLVFLPFPKQAWISYLRTFALATLPAWNIFLHDFHSLASFHISGRRSNADSTISISNRTSQSYLKFTPFFFFWWPILLSKWSYLFIYLLSESSSRIIAPWEQVSRQSQSQLNPWYIE